MNGWATETWNASLWIGNDEFLYNPGPVAALLRCGLQCVEAAGILTTGDGVRYDDPAIDRAEMDEMISEL